MMHSCLYVGWVRHRRRTPVPHNFRYPLFMTYLDLSELSSVFAGRWLWSASRPACAWFRRADHFGSPDVPLETVVSDLVERETGSRPAGPIRLLTHLRYFGYVFNPVSFYYCFDAGDTGVETIVADVSNTPWGERHQYVLPVGASARLMVPKAFHVSPFMDMQVEYDWRFGAPSRTLATHMISRTDGVTIFVATLSLRRVVIGTRTLAGVLMKYPAMTAQVIAGIYWQALQLRRKGIPFHAHPRHGAQGPEVTTS